MEVAGESRSVFVRLTENTDGLDKPVSVGLPPDERHYKVVALAGDCEILFVF
ncbi:hypothetical Protein YC6258_02938 [Gynuella sunshinyii YC6258]|uniref:Uncharacterized protein n=1 Tax=Gynuella sunshinyii YC6258 TaxID=1445510 RepID=A0A0C5VKY9_9GAMM|nr:hypothetical Protein YC6258_02938 [Gynuella sunshinyii YC6258]